MMGVAVSSFEWASIWLIVAAAFPLSWLKKLLGKRQFRKIPRVDSLIILAVTVITPLLNLAIAVAIGCGLAALGFVWQSSKRVNVNVTTRPGTEPGEPEAVKVYEVEGLVYYAGIDHFLSHFSPANDPPLVEILLHQADLCDYSAMQALSTLSARYAVAGKRVRLRALREGSLRAMLKQSALMHKDLIDESHKPLLDALQERGGADINEVDGSYEVEMMPPPGQRGANGGIVDSPCRLRLN
jgi:SulP family sulfate permease